MPKARDPTKALRDAAEALPNVVAGTSCNQTSYKTAKKAFLYIGPGAKGVGYKAMFEKIILGSFDEILMCKPATLLSVELRGSSASQMATQKVNAAGQTKAT